MSLVLLALVGCLAGRTRLQVAGEDTLVDRAELGVDPETGSVLLANYGRNSGFRFGEVRELWGVPAGTSDAVVLLDLHKTGDVRVVYGVNEPVVLFKDHEEQHLVQLHPSTLEVVSDAVLPYDFGGTRVSPSRRWMLVSDNDWPSPDLVLVDLQTFDAQQVSWTGTGIEAQWLPDDRMVGVVKYRPEESGPEAVQLIVWNNPDDSTDPLAQPDLTVVFPTLIIW